MKIWKVDSKRRKLYDEGVEGLRVQLLPSCSCDELGGESCVDKPPNVRVSRVAWITWQPKCAGEVELIGMTRGALGRKSQKSGGTAVTPERFQRT